METKAELIQGIKLLNRELRQLKKEIEALDQARIITQSKTNCRKNEKISEDLYEELNKLIAFRERYPHAFNEEDKEDLRKTHLQIQALLQTAINASPKKSISSDEVSSISVRIKDLEKNMNNKLARYTTLEEVAKKAVEEISSTSSTYGAILLDAQKHNMSYTEAYMEIQCILQATKEKQSNDKQIGLSNMAEYHCYTEFSNKTKPYTDSMLQDITQLQKRLESLIKNHDEITYGKRMLKAIHTFKNKTEPSLFEFHKLYLEIDKLQKQALIFNKPWRHSKVQTFYKNAQESLLHYRVYDTDNHLNYDQLVRIQQDILDHKKKYPTMNHNRLNQIFFICDKGIKGNLESLTTLTEVQHIARKAQKNKASFFYPKPSIDKEQLEKIEQMERHTARIPS